MNTIIKSYCLDSNVLIQAWQKYYSPKYCPTYWEILDELGYQSKIFIPIMIYEEITRTDDELSNWLKNSRIEVKPMTNAITTCLKLIYSNNPNHKYLVDSKRGRSLADPWVIAHAINENATVVTKEEKVTALNTKKIKIPNVCENMNIRWINDFDMITELGIKFSCKLHKTY